MMALHTNKIKNPKAMLFMVELTVIKTDILLFMMVLAKNSRHSIAYDGTA